jgi:hypothetical protein
MLKIDSRLSEYYPGWPSSIVNLLYRMPDAYHAMQPPNQANHVFM